MVVPFSSGALTKMWASLEHIRPLCGKPNNAHLPAPKANCMWGSPRSWWRGVGFIFTEVPSVEVYYGKLQLLCHFSPTVVGED